MTRLLASLLALSLTGTLAHAQADSQTEIPLGLWATPPDQLGIVFHVRTRRCGRNLCGRVERVKNRNGYDTPSNAVSQKVLWDMRPQPDGSFFGETRDSAANRYTQSRVEMRGNLLYVRACEAGECREQEWKRLR